MPPSTEFAKYNEILPGAAERILALAEKEVDHRHKNNEDKIIKIAGRGQILSAIVSFLSLAAIGMSIHYSQPVAALAPAIIAITGLISVFTGRNKSQHIRQQQDQ